METIKGIMFRNIRTGAITEDTKTALYWKYQMEDKIDILVWNKFDEEWKVLNIE